MPRVTDDVVQELIDNDGCRRGDVKPIHPTGIVRLALDLQDARRRVAELELNLRVSAETIKALGRLSEDRANEPTPPSGRKRTKKRKT